MAGFFLIVFLVVGALVLLDYMRYAQGNRSLLFGTLNSYSQNQTLRFDALDVRVTSTTGKIYSSPTPDEIAFHQKCQNNQKYIVDSSGKLVSNPQSDWACNLWGGSDAVDQYNDFYQYERKLTVWFTYQNASDQPFNINSYKFTLAANTVLRNNDTCDMQSGNLLPGPPLSSCLYTDLDKNYNGPLRLLLQHNGKTKSIAVSVPKNSGTVSQ